MREGASLEAYDSIMDDFLSEQRQMVGEGWGEKAATATGNREFDDFRKGWSHGRRPKEVEEGGEEDDSWMESHPFFAGLRVGSRGPVALAQTHTMSSAHRHPLRVEWLPCTRRCPARRVPTLLRRDCAGGTAGTREGGPVGCRDHPKYVHHNGEPPEADWRAQAAHERANQTAPSHRVATGH